MIRIGNKDKGDRWRLVKQEGRLRIWRGNRKRGEEKMKSGV